MKRPYTITATDMRSINRSAILELIRRESPISRTAIAKALDVSLPTVMRIIDDLLEEGLVRPQGSSEWSGGRRRSLLEFNAASYVVVGVDLSGSDMFGAIADLGGNILHEVEVRRYGSSADENYLRLVELIEQLLARPRQLDQRVLGIGVGAPGITIHQKGIVQWAPSLNWRDFPLGAKLVEKFKLPVMVDNDVNLAALGELWYGSGQGAQNMVRITIGTGIGAGVIIDGALYRGTHEASGEIGYLLPGRQFLGRAYGVFGALEGLASGAGIAEQARRILEGQRSAADLDQLTVEDVFVAFRRGEAWAVTLIGEVLDYWAIMISSLGAYLDPELIVLGGSVIRSADTLFDSLLERIEGTIPYPPRIVVSTLGARSIVLGAITTVLHNTADFFVVHKLS